jgi:hypothetical protein
MGNLSTADLLIKVGYFVKKKYICEKNDLSERKGFVILQLQVVGMMQDLIKLFILCLQWRISCMFLCYACAEYSHECHIVL